MRWLARGVLLVLVLLATSAAAWACPACKETLFDPVTAKQTLRAAQGYALSIGLLLGVPTLLVGGITAGIVRAARRHQHRADSQV